MAQPPDLLKFLLDVFPLFNLTNFIHEIRDLQCLPAQPLPTLLNIYHLCHRSLTTHPLTVSFLICSGPLSFQPTIYLEAQHLSTLD